MSPSLYLVEIVLLSCVCPTQESSASQAAAVRGQETRWRIPPNAAGMHGLTPTLKDPPVYHVQSVSSVASVEDTA